MEVVLPIELEVQSLWVIMEEGIPKAKRLQNRYDWLRAYGQKILLTAIQTTKTSQPHPSQQKQNKGGYSRLLKKNHKGIQQESETKKTKDRRPSAQGDLNPNARPKRKVQA